MDSYDLEDFGMPWSDGLKKGTWMLDQTVVERSAEVIADTPAKYQDVVKKVLSTVPLFHNKVVPSGGHCHIYMERCRR